MNSLGNASSVQTTLNKVVGETERLKSKKRNA